MVIAPSITVKREVSPGTEWKSLPISILGTLIETYILESSESIAVSHILPPIARSSQEIFVTES